MKIELIYDQDCPNVDAARAQIRRAIEKTALAFDLPEWDRKSPASPGYVRKYGSPSILVNGKDVAGAVPSEQNDCCRIYLDEDGRHKGVPSVEKIISAMMKVSNTSQPDVREEKKRGLIGVLDCCAGRSVDEAVLRAAGLGQRVS